MLDFSEPRDRFEGVLKQSLLESFSAEGQKSSVFKAVEYALFSGGKRFRPLLCYATGKALGLEAPQIDGWAVAIEFIHTYSLIHDDLPCMDDDDVRRGHPTTHKKFNEPVALLAGDALLTEAFGVLQRAYGASPSLALALTGALAKSAGGSGMILGQALDFVFDPSKDSVEQLMDIHLCKTGELMSLCLEGVGCIKSQAPEDVAVLKSVGLQLGFAFQLKDDLLDAEDNEDQSYLRFLGIEGTEKKLEGTHQAILKSLEALSIGEGPLQQLVAYNGERNR